MFGVRASRRAVIVAATAAVLIVVLIAARHLITRVVLQTVLSVATGYSVRIGSETLGATHASIPRAGREAPGVLSVARQKTKV